MWIKNDIPHNTQVRFVEGFRQKKTADVENSFIVACNNQNIKANRNENSYYRRYRNGGF